MMNYNKEPHAKKSLLIVAICLFAFGVYINYINLDEAFGSGSPYYNRTTNMDKWENPIPFLLLIDMVIIVVIAIIAKLVFSKSKD